MKRLSFCILIKFSPPKTTTPLTTTLPPPSPIENQHTILTFIKVSNHLLFFSEYFCKELNLIFNIFIFILALGFQLWTCWWFSLNDINGLYILKIDITWQHRNIWNPGHLLRVCGMLWQNLYTNGKCRYPWNEVLSSRVPIPSHNLNLSLGFGVFGI